LEFFV
jgi:hypothetical protein